MFTVPASTSATPRDYSLSVCCLPHKFVTRLPTVRCYLSALCHLQICAGFPDPSLSLLPCLNYMLKGVHRAHCHPRRPPHLHITPDLLCRIYHTWSQMDIYYNKSMLWAAFCLGFFGFLRSGEFTSTTNNSNSPDRLSPADIEVDSHINPGCVAVHIWRSKTDPFGVGTTVYLGSTGDVLRPVKAMRAYLALRPSTPGPLFIFHNGKALSQEQLIIHLCQALSNWGRYSGSECRPE